MSELTDRQFKRVVCALNAALAALPSQFKRLSGVAAREYCLPEPSASIYDYGIQKFRQQHHLARIAAATKQSGRQFGPQTLWYPNDATQTVSDFARAWTCRPCGVSTWAKVCAKCGRREGELDSFFYSEVREELRVEWDDKFHPGVINAAIELLEDFARNQGWLKNVPVVWVGDYARIIEKHIFSKKQARPIGTPNER